MLQHSHPFNSLPKQNLQIYGKFDFETGIKMAGILLINSWVFPCSCVCSVLLIDVSQQKAPPTSSGSSKHQILNSQLLVPPCQKLYSLLRYKSPFVPILRESPTGTIAATKIQAGENQLQASPLQRVFLIARSGFSFHVRLCTNAAAPMPSSPKVTDATF